ncbi:FCS-Like Zinc finger 8-like isoform X1 [Zingiber officinale]|uniref:FCS-Like Zinc finger 8-like isoform X1 n=1 Tax=Zingiber officinale TaxID=94328 RepID=UPI001C4C80DA|nr:FCS-Like Zinc finger 8-like isoform X1 [Zingiber officinale]
MLKRRSRSVGGKQGLMMSDSNSPLSPSASKTVASSHLLLRSFSSKRFADIEAAMSPTSILETRPFSSSANLMQPKKPPFDSIEPIGLGIVDALNGEKNSQRRMVVFGPQLKIQIPTIASVEFPNSPIEFGVKNKESQLALFSPARISSGHEVPAVSRSISMSEMELSEDYTRVISHGPNPKTTHIFDNCILEPCINESIATAAKENSADEFLTSCYACKQVLGPGTDIFMYRSVFFNLLLSFRINCIIPNPIIQKIYSLAEIFLPMIKRIVNLTIKLQVN